MDIIKILQSLIKIDSTNPPGNEKDVTRYIASLFEGYEKIEEIDLGGNRASLVVNIEGETNETVAFIGHIDTVPVPDLNKIQGGESTNIIPDYCRAEIDIRTNPDLGNSKVLDFLNKQIKRLEHKYKGLKIKNTVLTNRPALEMDKEHKYVKELAHVLNKLNMKVDYKGVNYFTDLSLTQTKLPKPFIIYGPGYEEKGASD